MVTEIIQYEPEHAFDILDRNVREHNVWLSTYPDWEKWVRGYKKEGPAFTLIIDDQIIACAGVILMDWDRGEAWTLFSSLIAKYKLTVIKQVTKYLGMIAENNNLKRIQALVSPEREGDQRFIEFLGFEYEGLLRKYGPFNDDHMMYARIY
jgi:RimJ/RimL family protein N-acetyltransferase